MSPASNYQKQVSKPNSSCQQPSQIPKAKAVTVPGRYQSLACDAPSGGRKSLVGASALHTGWTHRRGPRWGPKLCDPQSSPRAQAQGAPDTLQAATQPPSQARGVGGAGANGAEAGSKAPARPRVWPFPPPIPSYLQPPPLLTTTRYAYPVTRNPGCNQEKLRSESLSKPEQTWLDRPLTRLGAAAPVFCAPWPGEDQSSVLGDSCLSCFSTNARAPLSHNEPRRPAADPGVRRGGWKSLTREARAGFGSGSRGRFSRVGYALDAWAGCFASALLAGGPPTPPGTRFGSALGALCNPSRRPRRQAGTREPRGRFLASIQPFRSQARPW
ncbi:translation initiation factor IF-2 [Cebus imitator]|uniref:translation initiation factor IF-2 n=1 Tax=Cebus imitator TaxID=2715852 RepID=UPI00080A736F|nr:translation initiation factor IF-2 [Cebus imitator]